MQYKITEPCKIILNEGETITELEIVQQLVDGGFATPIANAIQSPKAPKLETQVVKGMERK